MEAPDDFGRDKNVVGCLDEIAFRIAQKTKAFAGNLDDSFAVFRFARAARSPFCDCPERAPRSSVGLASFSAEIVGNIGKLRRVLAPAFGLVAKDLPREIGPVAWRPLGPAGLVETAVVRAHESLRRPDGGAKGGAGGSGALVAWGIIIISSLIIETGLHERTRSGGAASQSLGWQFRQQLIRDI